MDRLVPRNSAVGDLCFQRSLFLQFNQQSGVYNYNMQDGLGNGLINCALLKDETDLLGLFAEAIDQELSGQDTQPYFLIQYATKVFPFFLDVDPHLSPTLTSAETNEFHIKLLKHVNHLLRNLFEASLSENLLIAVVLKNAESNNLHVYFPNLRVTKHLAVQVAAALKKEMPSLLEETIVDFARFNLPDQSPETCIGIDEAVYNPHPNLRMPGSHKCAKCKDCHGDSKGCTNCKGGKIDAQRVYRLWVVLDSQGACSPELARVVGLNATSLLQFCTLRCYDTSTLVDTFLGESTREFLELVQDDPDGAQLAAFRNSACSGKNEQVEKGPPRELHPHLQYSLALGANTEEFSTCVSVVRRFNPSLYGNMEFRTIKKSLDGCSFRVTVSGQGSKICGNLVPPGSSHTSQMIYFVITFDGCAQRCWCRCVKLERRVKGMCSTFWSGAARLTIEDRAILFPNGPNEECTYGAHRQKQKAKEKKTEAKKRKLDENKSGKEEKEEAEEVAPGKEEKQEKKKKEPTFAQLLRRPNRGATGTWLKPRI